MQGTFVNLCYTMENHAIATMMTYFGSTDHRLGTEVDRVRGGVMSSKNRLDSPLYGIIRYTLFCFGLEQSNIPTAPLQKGKTPSNDGPEFDTKQSDGEVPIMLKLWGIQSTPSLLSLPGPLWHGLVAPERVLSMGQIALNCVLMLSCIA